MNNKLILIVLLFVLFSVIYQNINPADITGYTVYNQGGTFESGGKTVKIVKISPNNAVVEVDGIKNIIMIGDHKTVNGVDIKVINVFFTEEEEGRNVDLSVNVIELTKCGDKKCQSNEDSSSCCKDCGCQADYKCRENECIYSADECWQASDCDDENPETTDLCMGTPKKCINLVIKECETDEDCNDNKECTIDKCENNECFNTKKEECSTVNETKKEEQTTGEEIKEKTGFFSKIISFFKGLFGS